MVKVAKIVVTRAEGRHEECGIPHECKTFAEANTVLRKMARTAPDGGGYDKTDFVVTYEDGETYEGRFDLTFTGNELLENHMRGHVEFSAGVKMPYHFVTRYGEGAKARYESYLNEIVKPEGVEAYKKFLATYALEDVS
jgi:hypothetical protein